MNHDYAIETHAAERYLLHELTEEERDAYEEHFFSCSICADEVKSASDFLDGARQVVQDELKKHIYREANHYSIWAWLDWRTMRRPMPAMACALLAVVSVFSVYQNRVTIPQLASAQVVAPQPILRHSKGDAVNALIVTRGKGFSLRFDNPTTTSNSYDISVLTLSNVKKFSLKIPPQEITERLEIFVPAGKLDAGRYILLIEDGPSKGEVDRIPFDITYQD